MIIKNRSYVLYKFELKYTEGEMVLRWEREKHTRKGQEVLLPEFGSIRMPDSGMTDGSWWCTCNKSQSIQSTIEMFFCCHGWAYFWTTIGGDGVRPWCCGYTIMWHSCGFSQENVSRRVRGECFSLCCAGCQNKTSLCYWHLLLKPWCNSNCLI